MQLWSRRRCIQCVVTKAAKRKESTLSNDSPLGNRGNEENLSLKASRQQNAYYWPCGNTQYSVRSRNPFWFLSDQKNDQECDNVKCFRKSSDERSAFCLVSLCYMQLFPVPSTKPHIPGEKLCSWVVSVLRLPNVRLWFRVSIATCHKSTMRNAFG